MATIISNLGAKIKEAKTPGTIPLPNYPRMYPSLGLPLSLLMVQEAYLEELLS